MSHAIARTWKQVLAGTLVCVAVMLHVPAHAHVHWTRINGIDSDTIALYHFENATSAVAPPSGELPDDLGLTPFSGANSLNITTDTPGPLFIPNAVLLNATQTLRTTSTVTNLDGDITIECWFKWTPTMTSSTLEIGLASGARLMIARDVNDPENDRIGVAGTHGSYMAALGFSNWTAMGDEEASLNEWRHLALAIHSTGIHFDSIAAHDVYSTGTTGLISLNGHALGFSPFTFDLGGLKVHDASRLTVIMRGSGIAIDEATFWRRDWNENGAVLNPYSDGRGGQAGVVGWNRYDE